MLVKMFDLQEGDTKRTVHLMAYGAERQSLIVEVQREYGVDMAEEMIEAEETPQEPIEKEDGMGGFTTVMYDNLRSRFDIWFES